MTDLHEIWTHGITYQLVTICKLSGRSKAVKWGEIGFRLFLDVQICLVDSYIRTSVEVLNIVIIGR